MTFKLHRAPLWMLCLASVALVGCARTALTVDSIADIEQATAARGAIEFRVEPEPIDVNSAIESAELSVARAAELALQHSPELQAALARVRSAQAQSTQARLLPNPILSVAIRFPTSGGGKPEIEAGLAADVISIFQQPRRASAADARLRAASAEALSSALDVIAATQTTFISIQALEAELVVLNQRKQLMARLLDLAKSRVEAGESSRLDVLTLNSERVALEVEVMEKETDRKQQRLELARMLGAPGGRSDWQIAAFEPVLISPVDEQAWITAALAHRPELQARRWEYEAISSEAKLAGWAIFDGGDLGVEAERDDGWTVGPAISTPLPVFDWGQARREKARAELIEARHEVLQTQRTIVQEVRQAIEALNASQSALAVVRDELIPLQQQRIAQAETAYRNGLSDVTSVVVAEGEAQAARQKLIELQQKSAAALYRLHRAVGGQGRMTALPTKNVPSTKPHTQATP